MTDASNRRAFLRVLAAGAVYAAPVIASVAAPVDLLGQGQSSQHKMDPTAPAPNLQQQQQQPGAPPPWRAPPPGRP
jgi:hypothetical protein